VHGIGVEATGKPLGDEQFAGLVGRAGGTVSARLRHRLQDIRRGQHPRLQRDRGRGRLPSGSPSPQPPTPLDDQRNQRCPLLFHYPATAALVSTLASTRACSRVDAVVSSQTVRTLAPDDG
jgi:hypothetical protein